LHCILLVACALLFSFSSLNLLAATKQE
jgi:hypothetical protein